MIDWLVTLLWPMLAAFSTMLLLYFIICILLLILEYRKAMKEPAKGWECIACQQWQEGEVDNDGLCKECWEMYRTWVRKLSA